MRKLKKGDIVVSVKKRQQWTKENRDVFLFVLKHIGNDDYNVYVDTGRIMTVKVDERSDHRFIISENLKRSTKIN